MHIPDALLDPRVAAVTGLVGAGGPAVRAAAAGAASSASGRPVLMGTMSAFVFAAQMVNFPVGPGSRAICWAVCSLRCCWGRGRGRW